MLFLSSGNGGLDTGSSVGADLLSSGADDDVDEAADVELTLLGATSLGLLLVLTIDLGCVVSDLTGTSETSVSFTFQSQEERGEKPSSDRKNEKKSVFVFFINKRKREKVG